LFKVHDVAFEGMNLVIKFTSDNKMENLKAEFRLKDMTRYAVSAYNHYFETKVTSTENNHEIIVNTSIFTELPLVNLTSQVVWIYINNNGQFDQLKLGKEMIEKVKKVDSFHFSNIANIKFRNNSNNLALTISKINASCILNDMQVEENQLVLGLLPIEYNNEILSVSNIQLKKRIFKDTQIYSHGIELKNIIDNIYSLELDQINAIEFDKVNNLDFIVEIQDRNVSIQLPLFIKENLKLTELYFNSKLSSKLYSTVKKSLSMRVTKESHEIEIMSCDSNKQTVSIVINLDTLETNNSDNLKCGLFRQNKLFNDPELILYKEIGMVIKKDIAFLEIDINKLFGKVASNSIQNYILALFDSKSKNEFIYHLTSSQILEFTEKMPSSIISFKVEKEAKLVVKPIQLNPVRLSILGSCFSRAAFNSSNNFFNPDYKLCFSLDYSHFWISLISAVNEKIPFDISKYHDVPEKVIDNVKKEYEKTTFEDLKKVNSDYIIVDFFVDAVHGVRRFPDGNFIGQNGDLHNSYYYKNQFLKETSQFDIRHPDFWNTWKAACDTFIKRLEPIIGMDKIILNLGGLSDLFYNENREASNFSKEKKFTSSEINFINRTWEKMNNYFISKVPSAKIIDLSQYNYYASLDYPYGGSGPHHYERNYYKTFLGELSKIILMDKIR
jgi:hypothetical protein